MPQAKDTDWLKGYKTRPIYICCLQETHLRPKDTYRLKVRGWKNIYHANGNQKKVGVEFPISDKINLKTTPHGQAQASLPETHQTHHSSDTQN